MSVTVAELTLQQIKEASRRLSRDQQEELLIHLGEGLSQYIDIDPSMAGIEHPPVMSEEEVVAELERRMDAIRKDPSKIRPWDEVKKELEQKFR